MSSVINKNEDKWLRPWNITEFDDLYNRDERFFSILIKGLLGYLTRNIVMYNKPIKHYIINTGSSYMYVESNGYEYNLQEVSGEDWMYSELPRCVVDIDSLNIPMEELSQSYARGNYERKTKDNIIQGYNAEMKRMPIEMTFNLHYVFGTFNESIVVLQEILEKIIFQKYFKIAYLGQIINCSVEFPNNGQIQFNKPDFSSLEKNQKQIDLSIIINANYPVINENSSIEMWKQIRTFAGYLNDVNDMSSDIIIEIDGVVSKRNEIYIDLTKYDLNGDGIIDENEINVIDQFIDICDVDNDGIVTSKDINIITEIFMNNEYNINFDILHIGSFDMKNLLTIKKLFHVLDINNDNSISYEEVQQITEIINKINKIKINNQLTIGFVDLINIIKYVKEHDNLSFVIIIKDFNNYLYQYIKSEHPEFYSIINELLRDKNYNQIKIEINKYKENISTEIYNKLLILINQIIEFKKYDLNEDDIIDKNDIDMFVEILNEITHKNITYYSASRIYLHNNGDVNDKNTITDTVEYIFDDKQEG